MYILETAYRQSYSGKKWERELAVEKVYKVENTPVF